MGESVTQSGFREPTQLRSTTSIRLPLIARIKDRQTRLNQCCDSAEHTAWKVRDGFTKGIISSVAQTPDGYLWLGTEFGLVRFDGVRTVPWESPSGQRLPSNQITSLVATRDGTIWIGTRNGLASLNHEILTIYPQLAGQWIHSMIQDHEGTIWAGGAGLRSRHSRHECTVLGR